MHRAGIALDYAEQRHTDIHATPLTPARRAAAHKVRHAVTTKKMGRDALQIAETAEIAARWRIKG